MRQRPITDVHLVLVADGRVLLGLRRNTGFSDGCWHLPSGHLEEGESLAACAAREAFEELGLVLAPSALRLVHLSHIPESGGRLQSFFTVEAGGQTPRNLEPGKCGGLRWFPLDRLPDTVVPYAARALAAIARGEPYADSWPR